jgi:RNA polymerase sigma-70 factor (ECF subfamily)
MSVAAEQLEEHRAALTGHCYRMLGSIVDADDAVQETIVRAWRSLDRFQGRAALRTWRYRIATNVCLDALSSRARRARPIEDGPVRTVHDALEAQPRTHWLEPVPDERALPSDADPSELAVLRESIRLAFVAALQHLPPRQRAALLLTEVLGWSAAEVAGSLDLSVAAVNSALQRARATLPVRTSAPAAQLTDEQARMVDAYVDAFERYDVDALTALLHQDATLSMPPYTMWLRGHESIKTWLLGRGAGCRGSRLVRTAASAAPAFAQYRPSANGPGHDAWALIVLEPAGDRFASMVSFLDVQTLFPRFGLPLALD